MSISVATSFPFTWSRANLSSRLGSSPTTSTSESKVKMAKSSMPWEGTDAGTGKYQYHPGGDSSAAPKEAPSAVNVVVVPDVTLPKVSLPPLAACCQPMPTNPFLTNHFSRYSGFTTSGTSGARTATRCSHKAIVCVLRAGSGRMTRARRVDRPGPNYRQGLTFSDAFSFCYTIASISVCPEGIRPEPWTSLARGLRLSTFRPSRSTVTSSPQIVHLPPCFKCISIPPVIR